MSTQFGIFGLGEPTWGEINYRAFNVCSNDFHNELYGYVQRHLESQKGDGKFATEKEVDSYLESKGLKKTGTGLARRPINIKQHFLYLFVTPFIIQRII